VNFKVRPALVPARRLAGGLIFNPSPEQLIADREHHGTDEETDHAARNHAAQGAQQHHRHRHVDASSQH
jgi:hypothetical protein